MIYTIECLFINIYLFMSVGVFIAIINKCLISTNAPIMDPQIIFYGTICIIMAMYEICGEITNIL